MPFVVDIDQASALVVSTWRGSVASADLTAYIAEVWTDPRVRGFCELIDFRAVERVDVTSDAIHQLAVYSRSVDAPDLPVGSAVVAADQLIYGLSRMFASVRALEPGEDLREYRIFADPDAARLWLAGFRRTVSAAGGRG